MRRLIKRTRKTRTEGERCSGKCSKWDNTLRVRQAGKRINNLTQGLPPTPPPLKLSDNSFPGDDLPSKRVPFPARTKEHVAKDRVLQKVAEGLLYGSIVKDQEIASECKVLFKGLGNHILLLLSSQSHFVARLDGKGSIIKDNRSALSSSPSSSTSSKHSSQPVPLMGSFRLLAPLHEGADPFVINHALVSMLCDGSGDAREAALEMIKYLVMRAKEMAPADAEVAVNHLLFEHLLSTLLQACLDKPWNLKSGAYDGIFLLCKSLSLAFAAPFETQIMTAAIFILKDSPREVSSAAVEGSLGFLVHMLTFFHGDMEAEDDVWVDTLALPGAAAIAKAGDKENNEAEADAMEVEGAVDFKPPPPETLQMLTNELTSSKHIVRFGARLAIQHISNSLGTSIAELLKTHEAALKKILFGKSFSSLPLVEQVGITETLTFLISKAPGMLELDANIASTLKAMMNAGNDFDGSEGSGSSSSSNSHASAIFLRGASSLSSSVTGGPTITIQSELPHGIQLRVSAILFCRALIQKNKVGFFMNDSIKGLSDVRTTAMELIFKSMVSSYPQAVLASHVTLQELVEINEKPLGEVDEDFTSKIGDTQGLDSDSKLDIFAEETLKKYLKPIIVKLADHKNLSLHLSSGLSKLLVLLGSRFNPQLAEKLLDHLQHWKDSKKLIDSNVFRPGEEPLIAASLVNLFQYFPNVESMLEPLVGGKVIDPLKTRHGVPSAQSWGPKLTKSSASKEKLDLEAKDAMKKVEIAEEKHKGMKMAASSSGKALRRDWIVGSFPLRMETWTLGSVVPFLKCSLTTFRLSLSCFLSSTKTTVS